MGTSRGHVSNFALYLGALLAFSTARVHGIISGAHLRLRNGNVRLSYASIMHVPASLLTLSFGCVRDIDQQANLTARWLPQHSNNSNDGFSADTISSDSSVDTTPTFDCMDTASGEAVTFGFCGRISWITIPGL